MSESLNQIQRRILNNPFCEDDWAKLYAIHQEPTSKTPSYSEHPTQASELTLVEKPHDKPTDISTLYASIDTLTHIVDAKELALQPVNHISITQELIDAILFFLSCKTSDTQSDLIIQPKEPTAAPNLKDQAQEEINFCDRQEYKFIRTFFGSLSYSKKARPSALSFTYEAKIPLIASLEVIKLLICEKSFSAGLAFVETLFDALLPKEIDEYAEWLCYYKAKCFLGLGDVNSTISEIQLYKNRFKNEGCALNQISAAFEVLLVRAHLEIGNLAQASESRINLHKHSNDALFGSSHEIGVIEKSISTLEWLRKNPDLERQNNINWVDDCGLCAALEKIGIDPRKNHISIQGWIIDRESQLSDIILLSDTSAFWIDLARLVRTSRVDLEGMAKKAGVYSTDALGFTTEIVLSSQQFKPLNDTRFIRLLFILKNGKQFCLHCPPALEQNSYFDVVKSLLSLSNGVNHPCFYQLAKSWSSKYPSCRLPHKHLYKQSKVKAELAIIMPITNSISNSLIAASTWQSLLNSHFSCHYLFIVSNPNIFNQLAIDFERIRTIYGISHEVIIVNDKTMHHQTPALGELFNIGLEAATADTILLQSEYAVPSSPTAIPSLYSLFLSSEPDTSIISPSLATINKSIYARGLSFVSNNHSYDKSTSAYLSTMRNFAGLSGKSLKVTSLTNVQAVTADVVMITRKNMEALAPLNPFYSQRDYFGADLCMTARLWGLNSAVSSQEFTILNPINTNTAITTDSVNQDVILFNSTWISDFATSYLDPFDLEL